MKAQITRYKGFVIIEESTGTFKLYTKEEYSYGKGVQNGRMGDKLAEGSKGLYRLLLNY